MGVADKHAPGAPPFLFASLAPDLLTAGVLGLTANSLKNLSM
jgi:hypothetical protein